MHYQNAPFSDESVLSSTSVNPISFQIMIVKVNLHLIGSPIWT